MNGRNAPGYIMLILTCVVMIIAFITAFSGGDNPTNQDILNAIAILTGGIMALIGYFATLLWDKLCMLAHLYEILTGDEQEELAGTLQRLRNTFQQAANNIRFRIESLPSSDPNLRQEDMDEKA
jgi:hypothetical protein